MEWKHTEIKKKVLGTEASKEGYADSLPGHEKTHYY